MWTEKRNKNIRSAIKTANCEGRLQRPIIIGNSNKDLFGKYWAVWALIFFFFLWNPWFAIIIALSVLSVLCILIYFHFQGKERSTLAHVSCSVRLYHPVLNLLWDHSSCNALLSWQKDIVVWPICISDHCDGGRNNAIWYYFALVRRNRWLMLKTCPCSQPIDICYSILAP